MKFSTKEMNQVLIIEIYGEIMGGGEADEFRKIIYKAIENDNINIILDLSHASWMNSSGLGMLISGLTTVRSSGGDLRLANMSDRVRRPLEISKLENVFLTYDTVDKAVMSYKKK